MTCGMVGSLVPTNRSGYTHLYQRTKGGKRGSTAGAWFMEPRYAIMAVRRAGLTISLGVGPQCQTDNPYPRQKTKRIPNPKCLLECCATAPLSVQEDLKSARSRWQEITEDASYSFVLHPKPHYELNWIEYYWGCCKFFARRHYNYTLPSRYTDRIIVKCVKHG